MALLVVAKILAVSITIGSGGSGGVFAPSLFIGAMLGGAVGTVVHTLWPATTAGAGAYALVGMGAVVAAGTHAPITAILIIFELTGEYRIILPLMISCIIATLLATRMQRASIYTLKLLRRGIDIHRGKALNVLQNVPVRAVMREDFATASPEDGLPALLATFIDHPGSTVFVIGEDGRMQGIITADEIRPVMRDPSVLEVLVIAEDLCVKSDIPRVRPDDSLAEVMKSMESYRGEVPVMDDGRLVGVIWPEDVIERYNTEVFMRDMAGNMATAVQPDTDGELFPGAGGAVVAEVPAPPAFAGKSIAALDVRRTYGVSVLMVRHSDEHGKQSLTTSPPADYTFRSGDVLLVLGPGDRIRQLQRGSWTPAASGATGV
ncbi:MAG: chloride channel protein, partial [Gemmatimonadota bacterium]|nr:chloride channel protein [Gemmatimonadota bacterium]